jgi:hypothetical protein
MRNGKMVNHEEKHKESDEERDQIEMPHHERDDSQEFILARKALIMATIGMRKSAQAIPCFICR